MAIDVRDVATDGSELDPAQQYYRDFMRISFPSPVGTLRLTNRRQGYVGDIDGSSQTWVFKDFEVGRISQGRESAMTTTWFEITDWNQATEEFEWTGYAESPSIRGVPITIWRVHFDPATADSATPTRKAIYPLYFGQMDESSGTGRKRVALLPPKTLIGKASPPDVWGPLCTAADYGDGLECTRVPDVEFPTCPRTREACEARGNLGEFNGDPWIPPPGDKTIWGNTETRAPDYPGAPVPGYVPVRQYIDPVTGLTMIQWSPADY